MNIIKHISTFLAVLSSLCVGVMMMAICSDVFARLFFDTTIYGVVEYSEFLMIGLVYFGLAHAEAKNQHISVDLLTSRLPSNIEYYVVIAGKVITIAVVAWLVIASTNLALTSVYENEFRFGLVTVPVWPDRIVISVGWLWLLLQLISNLINNGFKRDNS